MGANENSEPSHRGPGPKVWRVINKYDLEGQPEELAARWCGEEGQRRSLRSLAHELNRNVLEAAMRETGLRPIDGEVENLYRLLTDDDVTDAKRTEAETKLERNGLDPAEVQADFVSHQAVHTYLREHLGVGLPESEEGDRMASAKNTIQRMSGRLRSVAEQTLERLEGDELTLGDPELLISVQVYCNECGRQFNLEELLERGGCDCDT